MIDVIHLFVQDDQVLLTNNECRYSLLVIKAFLETYRVVLYTQYLTSRFNICLIALQFLTGVTGTKIVLTGIEKL